jgi:tetratricopeptide (TPR) repeat protein/transcriptional regulator with XRE-family HTH domain
MKEAHMMTHSFGPAGHRLACGSGQATGRRGGRAVAESTTLTFGELLRQLRSDAGLTQEELADAAGLSTRSISDLERGINQRPRKDTARLLADALTLTGEARAGFDAAARGVRPEASTVAAATRMLPPDTASFTGRDAELTQLAQAVASAKNQPGIVGIYAIGGMAGVGKTAFAVHAAHQLAPQFPSGQIFLPLHGHTPGQRPVAPGDALASLLLTTGIGAHEIPPGLEPRMGLWRSHLSDKRMLILLDDASGHDQVWPLLPGTSGSAVLITSRRHLTALEDSLAISLDTLPADKAAELLVRLAGRPGLDPGGAAVREIVQLCGRLPLAIGMLGAQLRHHPVWTAAELAADLRTARDRLGLMSAENLTVAAAFDLSYGDLTADQQRLFRRLGLHPGTEVDVYAAAALQDSDPVTIRQYLNVLYDHYLLTEPSRGRYRFHDLIREHASALAAAEPDAESDLAIGRLLDYYAHTARSAERQLPRRASATMPPDAGPPPAHAPDLVTMQAADAWMGSEYSNLHAIASYAASHGRLRYAINLPAAMHGFLRSHGPWDQALALHQAALTAARGLGDQFAEAVILNDIGDVQARTGDYPAAARSQDQALEIYRNLGSLPGEAGTISFLGLVHLATGNFPAANASFSKALRLFRDAGHQRGEAGALADLGSAQYMTGRYPAAVESLTQALDLYRGSGDQSGVADVLNRLGGVQYLTGDFPAALTSLTQAVKAYRALSNQLGEAIALNYLGDVQRAAGDYRAAMASQEHALELARALGARLQEAGALTDIGAVQEATGDCQAAIISHGSALKLYRELGSRPGEALTLNHLGTAQHRAGNYTAAAGLLAQALDLYRQLGDRLGEAECLNNLGELSRATSFPAQALAHYEQAHEIAADLPAPLEQARALEGIGRCHFMEGRDEQGAVALHQAGTIYAKIGSPGAEQVQQFLSEHGL